MPAAPMPPSLAGRPREARGDELGPKIRDLKHLWQDEGGKAWGIGRRIKRWSDLDREEKRRPAV
jgi:hypothetical protein